MEDTHVLEDGGTIICDDHLPSRTLAIQLLNHLVHPTGTKTRTDDICNGLGRSDI